MSLIPIKSADELATAIENGKVVFDSIGNSYRKAKAPYIGYIMTDEDEIEFIIPSIEYEKDVYFMTKEK